MPRRRSDVEKVAEILRESVMAPNETDWYWASRLARKIVRAVGKNEDTKLLTWLQKMKAGLQFDALGGRESWVVDYSGIDCKWKATARAAIRAAMKAGGREMTLYYVGKKRPRESDDLINWTTPIKNEAHVWARTHRMKVYAVRFVEVKKRK